MGTRSGVLPTQTVQLRVVFEDQLGNLTDPDALPEVYIYDSTFTEDDIQAEVDIDTFTGLGPYTPTKISTGYYEYTYTVLAGAVAGGWHDLWLCDIDSDSQSEIFGFEVLEGLTLSLQTLLQNQLIVIDLSADITGLDTGLSLTGDIQFSYSTAFSPLYASMELIRLETGPWIQAIPDDTINLAIHWSSKEVDAITPPSLHRYVRFTCDEWVGYLAGSVPVSARLYQYARTKFVIYDAMWRLLNMPATAISGSIGGSGRAKKLGDLMIQDGKSGLDGAGAITTKQIDSIKKERDRWWAVVNAKGSIMPGQSMSISTAVVGIGSPDAVRIGRLIDSGGQPFPSGTITNKSRRYGRTRWRWR